MQTPPVAATAAAAAPPADRGHIARLSGALAALLGLAEGVELSEGNVLARLWQQGLIPSPTSTRAQGASPPHHRVRLSGALAKEMAGFHLPNTGYPVPLNLMKSCPRNRVVELSH
jgi:hypothetical protein